MERLKLGTMVEPIVQDDVQIPRVVVNDILSDENAHELSSALKLIRRAQGIPFDDGLLLIIHMFFWLVDWDRHQIREPALLDGLIFRDLPRSLRKNEAELMREVFNHPLTDIDKLLICWRRTQGDLFRGLAKPLDGVPGLPSYHYFPPHWLSIEDLRKLDGKDSPIPKVPVLMDADIAPFSPMIIDMLKLRRPFQQQANEPVPPVADVNRRISFRFKKMGQRWSVVYDFTEIFLNDTDGAVYIAYLLEHCGAPFHARELYAIAHPSNKEPLDAVHSNMSADELAEENLFMDNDCSPTDKLDDAERLATYRHAIAEMQREVEDARRNGEIDKAYELQTRLDDARGLMSAEFGLHGRGRKKGDPNRQAYDRVSKAIDRVLKAIKKSNLSLHTHFKNTLHHETYTYIYSPDKPINWDL
jgi:hypothetical protein